MWRVTVKGLLAYKLRLALTAVAIIIGVTFISGTFVLTDTLHNTFTSLFTSIYQKVDFQVQGVAQFTNSNGQAARNPVPQSVLPRVLAVPGVQAATGEVSGYAQFVGHDGKAIATGGAPTLGASYDPDPLTSPLHLISGGPPVNSRDVVMDAGTAHKHGFRVGQQVRVLLPDTSRTFTITGIARYGTTDNLAGATIAAFTLPTAQHLLNLVGQFNAIEVVVRPGADKAAVQQGIAHVLPKGVQVVAAQTVVDQQTNAIDHALGFFSTGLLVFAFIALFVGGFTILNTFSIIVTQRTRELALVRVVGASRAQVFRSVVGEAAIVGLLSSVVGIGLGVLAAQGLEALLRAFGISLPSGALVFSARTVVVGLLVGVGVTVIAAVSPARRAIRIAPVTAISDPQALADVPHHHRFAWGGSLAVAGVAALAGGVSLASIQLVALGAAGLFIGVTMLAPAVARPVAGFLGRPLVRPLGMAGHLGRNNSMRNPRRTAQSASALMVGLALVSSIAVFGASLTSSTTSSVEGAIAADLIITNTSSSGTGSFSDAVPRTVSHLPGVVAQSTIYGGQFEIRGAVHGLAGVTTRDLPRTVTFHMTSGTAAALAAGALLIDSSTAHSDHLAVGDVVNVKFARTGPTRIPIGGIYQPNALLGSYVVSAAYFSAHFRNPLPVAVLLRTNGSPSVQRQVERALAPYPNAQVQTRAQFDNAQAAQVNQLLGLIYALLGLAVLIALIGIVNTLLLSVLERTHEIGLLRAVGMKRRQVRTMIRSESVILAVFGALIGIVLGTGIGVALVWSMRSQGLTQTVVPVPTMLIFLVLAALLGLLAAGWPARRASRLDVLAAIATE